MLKRLCGLFLAPLLVIALLLGPYLQSGFAAGPTLDCATVSGDHMSVVAGSDYQAQVSWETVIDSSGYRILRDGALFKEMTPADSTYVNTLLIPAVSYSYEVLAECGPASKSLGSKTIVATGPPKPPVARASFSSYVSEGDSSAGGSYISPGPNESWARRYTRQVNDFFVGDSVPEENQHAGGSFCRDYSNGGSKYGVMERLQEKLVTPVWVQAQLVTIGVGTHELRTGDVTMEQYRDCMSQLAQLISPNPNSQLVRTLVFLTMTPDISGESLTNKHAPLRRAWNKAIKDAAYHAQVVVGDAEKAFEEAAAEAEANGECVTTASTDGEVVPRCQAIFQSDQAHPNWRGHDVMAQSVIKELLLNVDNDFAHRAVPGRPIASDIRSSAPAATPTIKFSWQAPSLPGSALRSNNTYEYGYMQAGTGPWTTAMTSATEASLPVPTGVSAPWWVKVRAFSSQGTPGPWSLFGHDSHLVPVEFFEETPHYRENDFIRDRSDMASVWDARDLPSSDPSKNCDDGCAYLIGGRGSSFEQISTDVFRYNPKTNRLTLLGPLLLNGKPLKVWGASAIWDGRDIYIIGGYQQTVISDRIVRYNPITGRATEVSTRLPAQAGNAGRAWLSAAWDPRTVPGCPEGCAFIFGGVSKLSNESIVYFDQVLRFDPSSDTIAVGNAKLPGRVNGPGRCCTAAVFDANRGIFHLFGGRVQGPVATGAGVIVDDILAYDPILDTVWIEATLSTPLQFTSAIFDGTNAYVFGGDVDGVRFVSDRIQRFSPSSLAITTLGQRLLSGRRLSAAVCDNNEAFILGGDWISKYSILHGSGIPSTLIGLASSEALRFAGINKTTSGCEPSMGAYPPLITSPAPGAIQGTAGVMLKGVGEQATTIRVFENGIEVASTATGGSSDWTVNITLAGGSHTLVTTATDSAGNQSRNSAPLTIVIDDVAPSAPVIVSPTEGAVLASRSVTVLGTAEVGANLRLMVAGTQVASKTVDATGNWSVPVQLAGGANVITATATDAAGNTSAASAARNVTVQVPVATVEARFGTKRWAAASVWDGRDRPAAGCPGGCAYVFGGDSEGVRLSEIVIYNTTNGQKFSGAGLSPARAGSAVAWTGRYAFLFGGVSHSGTFMNEILRYDSQTDSLATMKAQLPADGVGTTLGGRAFASAVWDGRDRATEGCPGGCAYIFGGLYLEEGTARFVNQIVRYNPTTDTVALSTAQLPALTPQTNARCCTAAAWDSQANVAYLFGGQRFDVSNVIFRFDATADQLSIVPTLLPRSLMIASAVADGQGSFYVFGGRNSDTGPSDEIVRYKPATGAIDVVAFLPEAVGGNSAVWTGSSALVFGGQKSGGTNTDTILRYTP